MLLDRNADLVVKRRKLATVVFEAKRWRVRDDGFCWLLEVRGSGWRVHARCHTRAGLWLAAGKRANRDREEFTRALLGLPERHPGSA